MTPHCETTPERWRKVARFPGYSVSDHGQVRSDERVIHRVNGTTYHVAELILKGFPQKRGGYMAVKLGTKQLKFSTVNIHTLVLEAFVGPMPEGLEACHDNGDCLDNHLTNLYWGTRSDNVRDAMRHGTWFNVGKHHAETRQG